MNRYEDMPIAFAYYRHGELIGYRADSFGTLDEKLPKIYHYSKEQLAICLNNIHGEVTRETGLGKVLADKLGKSKFTTILANHERNNKKKLEEPFEVRVVVAPEYEKELNVETGEWERVLWGGYPHEAVSEWLKHPEDHEVIEKHLFTVQGLVCES